MKSVDAAIGSFAEAVSVALREMAGANASLTDAVPPIHREGSSAIMAILPVTTSAGRGQLILCFPPATAAALTRRILNDDADDGMVRDCLGEVANVVAGQAKTRLVGSPFHFLLSTPSVAVQGPVTLGADWPRLSFVSEIGDFTMYLDLPSHV